MNERLEMTEDEKTVDLRQVEEEEVEESEEEAKEAGQQILDLFDYIRVNYERPKSRLKTFLRIPEEIIFSPVKIVLVRNKVGRLERIWIKIGNLIIFQNSDDFGTSAYLTDQSSTGMVIARNPREGIIFLPSGLAKQTDKHMKQLASLAGLAEGVINELNVPKGALSRTPPQDNTAGRRSVSIIEAPKRDD